MKKTRENIQSEAVNLSDNFNKIIFEIGTGVGKSLIAIKIIEKHGGLWKIIIAETTHEKNWKDEFIKHDKEHLLENVEFRCYQSLHKILGGENYIFDEIHHLYSNKRIANLAKIQDNGLIRLVGLSATLTMSQKDKIKAVIGQYHIYKVTLSDAITLGILPEPTVYFVGIELDNKYRYLKFNFNKDKSVLCTQREYYTKLSQRIEWLKSRYLESNLQSDKIRWMKSAMDRKKFLCECKTEDAAIILNKLESKRIICFTGSIEQSEKLSNGNCIHSKLGKKKVSEIIEKFNNGTINQIFATGMLKEGINLNNIHSGLIIQLDNTSRYFTQIHGRTLRSSFPEQYVMYVLNSQDEVYCKTALENFNMEYIKFIKMEDL